MLNILLKKLIKAASGRARFVLATIGLSIAMILILAAVQIQANYNELLYSKSSGDSTTNFLLINKNINLQQRSSTTLTDGEIEDLKKQPFTDAIGLLTPSHFKVTAESMSDKLPFYSDMFFESVPNDFLDINNPDWQWDENSSFIPLIIPNMFLDIYNFGFAISQGTPQLSQEAIKLIQVKLNIIANGQKTSYTGRIVGFSDRISSVLVPQTFMNWANTKFGTNTSAKPSRVVIKTKDPSNPKLSQYLKDHNLATDAEKTRFSKYRQYVSAAVIISWATGAIMLLFALLIFALFIQLTVASCKEEIVLLITLGTAPKQLQRFLMNRFFPTNVVIVVAVIILIASLQFLLHKFLQTQSMGVSPIISIYTIIMAALVLLVLWLVNKQTIKQYIKQTEG